jgi:hypothetical protein
MKLATAVRHIGDPLDNTFLYIQCTERRRGAQQV